MLQKEKEEDNASLDNEKVTTQGEPDPPTMETYAFETKHDNTRGVATPGERTTIPSHEQTTTMVITRSGRVVGEMTPPPSPTASDPGSTTTLMPSEEVSKQTQVSAQFQETTPQSQVSSQQSQQSQGEGVPDPLEGDGR